MLEFQTKRGTGSYFPDEAIGFDDAGVKIGSTDRNITLIGAAADIPLGILVHDSVAADEAGGAIPKVVAIFGIFHESLPFVASGAIAADAEVVPDPANPGQFMQLPDGNNGSAKTPGSYYVVGRNRFGIAAAQTSSNANDRGDLIHKTPVLKVVSTVALASAQIVAAPPRPTQRAPGRRCRNQSGARPVSQAFNQERKQFQMKQTPKNTALAVNILASIGLGARESIIVHQPDGAFVHDRVLAYNAGLFEGANPNEFLSNYAVRYRDPYEDVLMDLGRFLSPDVPSSGSQFVTYPVYDFDDAMRTLDNLNDDIRAIGSDFNTLRNVTKTMTTQKIPNRGLAVEVDEDEEKLDVDWQQRKVAYLLGILNRNRLRRIVALAVAGAVNISKVWGTFGWRRSRHGRDDRAG